MSSNIGFNLGFVDQMYAKYLNDPNSVAETWRDFFADYRGEAPPPQARAPFDTQEQPALRPATAEAKPSSTANGAVAPGELPPGAEPLRGISAKIAENMVESLEVPTATSVREIPVKLLEENRSVINHHHKMVAGPKISFTHLIAYAIVKAVAKHPSMNSGCVTYKDGYARLSRDEINLGLAIDMEKRGERILLVPNLKNAAQYDFPGFVEAYNALVAKARKNTLGVDDFANTTMTITNPGMIGTAMSVPRLMQGQGTIIGIGAIGFPGQYAGMSPEVISELGLSRSMTMTSTYDHRVIQGAESGAFLKTINELLLGESGFYGEIYESFQVPHEPLTWSSDQNPRSRKSAGRTTASVSEAGYKDAAILQMIRAYRVRGHMWADLDPLRMAAPQPNPELELSSYGLSVWDLDREFESGDLAGKSRATLREIMATLRETYCRYTGVEFMHIPDSDQREWLTKTLESESARAPFQVEKQHRILEKLNAAEALERFLHTAYVGNKRFSLEGAETLIPMLDATLNETPRYGISETVIGMAHRGRLNVLANVVGKSHGQLFREFEGDIDPDSTHGSGDVKYHLGAKGVHTTPNGNEVRVLVSSNPSHLEAVNPVVEGMVRAMQDMRGDKERRTVLPLLVHGDAAFSGQGVVAETLNLSKLDGYSTGGTVHIVVNNQIGFTTSPEDLRSSLYATDVAKMIHAPVFHVNGDHPEAAVRAIEVALAYRHTFRSDVVIDLVCYRRWGHNEGDDPSYTQPLLYEKISKKRSVRKLYTEELLRRGDMDPDTAERALQDFKDKLREVHDTVQKATRDQATPEYTPPKPDNHETIDTSVDDKTLRRVLDGILSQPDDFVVHPKLATQLERRRGKYENAKIDWGLGEALAFGSLVLEGVPVRVSGEDSGRGTFSHRHAVLHDHKSGTPFVPLNNLDRKQARFEVHDSLLSEFAVLGFEYGYSVASEDVLVCWEAQFGDFVNGAQVIIDQFISSAEDKWMQSSGVTLLLPHGFEGQGPEHSSARIERFLQLAAEENIRISYPSTPAQYFHLLRRQAKLRPRKPLIVFTPKSLLRLPAAVSKAEDFSKGAFERVILDPAVAQPKGMLLCSGKVYYDLLAYRTKQKIDDVAIVRLEQFYPMPAEELTKCFSETSAKCVVWVQEEPRNMGAWHFLDWQLRDLLPEGLRLEDRTRVASASPAVGYNRLHAVEQQKLVEEAFKQARG